MTAHLVQGETVVWVSKEPFACLVKNIIVVQGNKADQFLVFGCYRVLMKFQQPFVKVEAPGPTFN